MAKKKTAKTKTKKVKIDAPAVDWRAYMEKIREEARNKQQNLLRKLETIGPELFAKGITSMTFEYNGEGDSGDMDYCYYEKNPAFGNKTIKDIGEENQDILKEIAWTFVPSGFENNDGGFGEVTFHFDSQKIHTRHNDRIVEIEGNDADFDFRGEKL